MADFQAPAFQNPNFLASYLQGQQGAIQAAGAPGALQLQQQDIQAGQLNMDQLRQTLATKGLINQYAQKLAGQDTGTQSTQTGQSPGGPTGGVQNGPQGAVANTQGGTAFGGGSVNTMMALDVLQGRDPMQTAKLAQQNQLEQTRLQLQGPMNLAQRVATDPQANIVVAHNPSLMNGFKQWAQARGLNPDDPTNLTVGNAQAAAKDYYSQLDAKIGGNGAMGFSGTLKPGEAAYQNGQMVAGSPDAMTPYQQQELSLRKQEAGLANARFQFDQNQSKIPSGYQVSASDPKSIEPIPGGPKDPNAATAGGMGGREGVMFQRIANAGNSAAESIKNIGDLPVTTSTGWFGNAHAGTSLLGSVKGVLTQKMNGQDIQDYQTMLAGVSRNLATLETSGLAPGGSLTHSMDALTLGQGDTQMTKLRKMAEMRQIVDTNLSPQLSNPKIPAPQKELIQGILDKVNGAVPFTHSDITKFEQSTNPQATIMDFAKSSGVQATADKNSNAPAAPGQSQTINGFTVTRIK